MAKAKLSEEMYDKVIEQVLVLDRSLSLAARTLGLDDTTAGRIVKTFQLVKAGDWDSIIEQINTGKTNPRHIEYAANKVGLSIPDEVYQAHEAYCDMVKEARESKRTRRQRQLNGLLRQLNGLLPTKQMTMQTQLFT